MAEEKELRVPIVEVSRVAVECKCGAEVTLDLSKPDHLTINWRDTAFECPICHYKFDNNLKNAFSDLSDCFVAAQESGEKIFFRLKQQETTS